MPDDRPTFEEFLRAVRAFAERGGARVVDLDIALSDGTHFRCPASLFPDRAAATSHSDDFASVLWSGTAYTFTTAQRGVVERLWAHWEAGMPGVTGESLIDAAGSAGKRLRDVFKGHPAWGTMIQAVRRGVYALVEPAGPRKSPGEGNNPAG